MIDVTKQQLQIIKNILKKYNYRFYAFGSRTKNKHKQFSDLDLCVIDDIPLHQATLVKSDFEDSDLPFTVDIIEWKFCDPDFRNAIKNDLVPIIISDNTTSP